MDGPAIVMLVVGAVFLWGGLLVAALSYWRSARADTGPGYGVDAGPEAGPDAGPDARGNPEDGAR